MYAGLTGMCGLCGVVSVTPSCCVGLFTALSDCKVTDVKSDSAVKRPTQQDGVTDTTPHKPHIPVKPAYITK
jgi:hypothetical protein